MSTFPTPIPGKSGGLIQGLLSSLVVLLSIGMSILLWIVVVIRIIFLQESLVSNADLIALFAVCLAFGLVCLPAAITGWMLYWQKPVILPGFQTWTTGGIILLAWILCLALGRFLPADSSIRAILFPLAHIGAVVFPILGILWFAFRGMAAHSLVKQTGVFNLALAVSPFLSIVLELILVIGIFVLLILFFILNPEQAASLQVIAESIQSLDMDTAQLELILGEYLRTPFVVLGMLVFFSFFVPLIEEAVKPAALLVFRSKLTRTEGFIYGLVSGAAFAFFETILAGLQTSQEEWLVVMLTRAGTGLLHMFTTALVGLGIAIAYEKRSFGSFLKYYGISVIIHGVWNAIAILNGVTQISPPDLGGGWEVIEKLSPFLLSAIVFSIIAGLIQMKRVFKYSHPEDIEATNDGERSL